MNKRELILVELKDGTSCRMAKTALKVFLSRGEVARFKRSDGWFVVGEDQPREKKNSPYDGADRREVV
jgi:hypothetical protein